MADPNFPPGTRVRVVEHPLVPFTDPNALGEGHIPKLGWVDAHAPGEFLDRRAVPYGTLATVSDIECPEEDWPFHDEQGGGFFLVSDGESCGHRGENPRAASPPQCGHTEEEHTPELWPRLAALHGDALPEHHKPHAFEPSALIPARAAFVEKV